MKNLITATVLSLMAFTTNAQAVAVTSAPSPQPVTLCTATDRATGVKKYDIAIYWGEKIDTGYQSSSQDAKVQLSAGRFFMSVDTTFHEQGVSTRCEWGHRSVAQLNQFGKLHLNYVQSACSIDATNHYLIVSPLAEKPTYLNVSCSTPAAVAPEETTD